MIEEIEAGIRNSIERGFSLEETVQSFITAGYNPVEVKEAANNVGQGASTIISPQNQQSQDKIKTTQQSQAAQPTQSTQQNQPTQGDTIKSQLLNQSTQQNQQSQINPISTTSKPLSQVIRQGEPNLLEQKNSKKKKSIILLLILFLILIAGIGVALIFSNQLLDLISKYLS